MPPKPKFQENDIVDAAFEAVRTKGWDGLSARSIAEALHCSTQPIYSYVRSMGELEEKVVKRIMDHLFARMMTPRTDDKWLDMQVGYVMFAKTERHLFRCINDERHMPLRNRYYDRHLTVCVGYLSGHSRFQALNARQIRKIMSAMGIYAHGLAVLVNNARPDQFEEPEITAMLDEAGESLYRGFADTFRSENSRHQQAVDTKAQMLRQIYFWLRPDGNRIKNIT